ncbi:Remorin, N-terminal [Dillenia turbinata]|uniref:Remorin, N-terminal n=1 Tax=Dillenia turbinata TaxID=194707 RepID=A0AAN8V8Y9_9MAGN
MGEEETKKIEECTTTEAPPAPAAAPVMEEPVKDVAEEKSVVPPPPEDKIDDSKALAIVEKPTDSAEEKPAEGSVNRDAVLARVETEKRLSLIRAWEENEKAKAENKAQKKLWMIGAWENGKKAALEAELKQIEKKLEEKKAEQVEKVKNKVALTHKSAEEKRAIIEAKRGEDMLKAEEMAAKYRTTGTAPKKLLGFF